MLTTTVHLMDQYVLYLTYNDNKVLLSREHTGPSARTLYIDTAFYTYTVRYLPSLSCLLCTKKKKHKLDQ